MAFSADDVIQKIIYSFLHKFELAVINDTHNDETYFNAARYGSIEYLTIHKNIIKNFNTVLRYTAAGHDQPEVLKLFILFGATDYNGALGISAAVGNLESIRYLTPKVTDVNIAFYNAVSNSHIDAMKLIASLGTVDVETVHYGAKTPEMRKLIKTILKID